MKEISEEMQMRIFDLLEGNLEEVEATQLLKEIEGSEVLKEEYQLMQMTYLPREDEVLLPVPFKESLYRKATVIPLGLFAKAAAVVCLIGTGSYFFYNFGQEQNKELEPKEIASNEVVKNKIVQPLAPVVVSDEDGNLAKAVVIKKSKMQNYNPNYSTIIRKSVNSNFNDSDVFNNVANANPNTVTDSFAPAIANVDVVKNDGMVSNKSNKRSWKPVEVILIDEPMAKNETTKMSQASLASRFFKSTKDHIRRGQTPDIDIKFNRRKLKFNFDLVSHL